MKKIVDSKKVKIKITKEIYNKVGTQVLYKVGEEFIGYLELIIATDYRFSFNSNNFFVLQEGQFEILEYLEESYEKLKENIQNNVYIDLNGDHPNKVNILKEVNEKLKMFSGTDDERKLYEEYLHKAADLKFQVEMRKYFFNASNKPSFKDDIERLFETQNHPKKDEFWNLISLVHTGAFFTVSQVYQLSILDTYKEYVNILL